MKSKEYLEEIRNAPGLKRAVLRRIEVAGRTVTFHLVTDVTYAPEDVEYARGVSQKYAPQGFSAEVRVLKSVPDAEAVRKVVAQILKDRFPGMAAFVDPEDIAVEIDEGGGRLEILRADLCVHCISGVYNITDCLYIIYIPRAHLADKDLMYRKKIFTNRFCNSQLCIVIERCAQYIELAQKKLCQEKFHACFSVTSGNSHNLQIMHALYLLFCFINKSPIYHFLYRHINHINKQN